MYTTIHRKCFWMPRFNFIGATGFDSNDNRTLKFWDLRKNNESIFTKVINSQKYHYVPEFDNDNGILYLWEQCGRNFNCAQIINDDVKYYPICKYRSGSEINGLAFAPKLSLDVGNLEKYEISRFFKLGSQNNKHNVVPISVQLPRKDKDNDMYKNKNNKARTNKASMTFDDYMNGIDKYPLKTSNASDEYKYGFIDLFLQENNDLIKEQIELDRPKSDKSVDKVVANGVVPSGFETPQQRRHLHMKLLIRSCVRKLNEKKFTQIMEILYKAHRMNMEEIEKDNTEFNSVDVVGNVKHGMALIIYLSHLRYFSHSGTGNRDIDAGDILPFFRILLKEEYLDSKLVDINVQHDKYDSLYYIVGSLPSDKKLNAIVQLLVTNGINTNKIYDKGCILWYIANNKHMSSLRLDLFKIFLESSATVETRKSSSVTLMQSQTTETGTETDEKKNSNETTSKTSSTSNKNVGKIGKVVPFDWNGLINTCIKSSVFHQCCERGYVDVIQYLLSYQDKYNKSTKMDVYMKTKVTEYNGLLMAYRGCKKLSFFCLFVCLFVF